MKWYETQIVGVIVGGLITMLANWLLRWNENRIETKNLKAGIKAEVLVFSKFIEGGLPKIQKYKEEFESTGNIPKLTMTGQFNFSFIDSNMSKIAALDEELMKKIIELRGLNEACTQGAKILFDSISLYHEKPVSAPFITLHLTALENSIKRMIKLSHEICT